MEKGESQNGCFRKTKHAKFSEKQTFLTPGYAHVRKFWQVYRKIWHALFSWNTCFEMRPFALLLTIKADLPQKCPIGFFVWFYIAIRYQNYKLAVIINFLLMWISYNCFPCRRVSPNFFRPSKIWIYLKTKFQLKISSYSLKAKKAWLASRNLATLFARCLQVNVTQFMTHALF